MYLVDEIFVFIRNSVEPSGPPYSLGMRRSFTPEQTKTDLGQSKMLCHAQNDVMKLFRKPKRTNTIFLVFRFQCFKAAWMTTVLHKGLKFPPSYHMLRSVQLINHREVQWTLGALLHRTRFLPLR